MNFATAGPASIVINDCTRGLVVRLATGAERLLAGLRAGTLDRQLAGGIPPESSPLLALRACAIVQPATRSTFARSLQRLVCHAAVPQPNRPVTLSAPTCRNIRDAANVLNLLIARLAAPCPVSAQGMAIVKLLLTDGTGPLYYPTQAGELPATVRKALSALDDPMT